jgi:hypothetical protein
MRMDPPCVFAGGDIIDAWLQAGKRPCGFILRPIGNRVGAQKNNRPASGGVANGGQAMEFKPSRRSVMAGIGAATAAPALAPIAAMARADASELTYRTAGELVQALANRQISSRELVAS